MSCTSDLRSEEFLKISAQFKLGALATETSHPVTAKLSEVAREDVRGALDLLFDVDADVIARYAEFAASGRAQQIAGVVAEALESGGRMFFTGCGSTGRLSIQLVSIWRNFWQRQHDLDAAEDLEHRAFSVMAGGDYALIKAVEGFEDFTVFGRRQLSELGAGKGDVVFAITEGGETSFVIGTAWQGLESGAKVYFVYNNPDDVLCRTVERSREIIQDARIEKINLTTGPMAITGSTRMQATSIQLCVLLTILEIVLRQIVSKLQPARAADLPVHSVPGDFLRALREMHATLKSAPVREQLAALVKLEEHVYRTGHRTNYFADQFGIDVLTDTTERSPTFCTPPFRKFDDCSATESWAFLFVPCENTPQAWRHIIKRKPSCVEWSDALVSELVEPEKASRTSEVLKKIRFGELMRFRVGLDGLPSRQLSTGDSAIVILSARELDLLGPGGVVRLLMENASRARASLGLVCIGDAPSLNVARNVLAAWKVARTQVLISLPETGFLLDGVTRVGLKMLLNAHSTCTMVRLGRVMGNYMIWVVASNLKLIDRATRYIQRLTDLDYHAANRLLFEVIEYVEPRMKSDQAYPPVVGMAVMRARHGLNNEAAEESLKAGAVEKSP
jgi:N-acetylmuramic acid 6-phosphate etherase